MKGSTAVLAKGFWPSEAGLGWDLRYHGSGLTQLALLVHASGLEHEFTSSLCFLRLLQFQFLVGRDSGHRYRLAPIAHSSWIHSVRLEIVWHPF